MPSRFKVLHVTSWLTRKGGGIPPVINALARETTRLGITCVVAGLKDEFFEADCASNKFSYLGAERLGSPGFGFSRELGHLIFSEITRDTIIHSHSLWMYPTYLARRCSQRTGAPLIISPHGMLEPWALKNSRLKKFVAARLFEDGNLMHAACLHALCVPEARNFRHYGLKNPIAVIPNGVDLEPFKNLPEGDPTGDRFPQLKGRKRILFLSRIHPKKGLPNLLQAWRKLCSTFPAWHLTIAGPDELGHEQELKALAVTLGLEKNVSFLGPLYGPEKIAALAGSDLFVLPSFSEGFSMAILEAAAAGLPVLLTKECNFTELATANAAVEVSPAVASVEAGLRRLLEMTDTERTALGKRGRALVEGSYTWPAVARQMLSVYEWLLHGGPKPACLYD